MYTFAWPLGRALDTAADYPGAAGVRQVLTMPGDFEDPRPESAAGKILKRDLREPHRAGQQTYVSGG